jgi:valyl-tRNA synthetase
VGTGGQDVRFNKDRIESYQRFANKIWNATRFLVTRLDNGSGHMAAPPSAPPFDDLRPEDRWMLSQVAETVVAVDESLRSYRFHEALERLYDVTWHSFCDVYVEMIKGRLNDDASATSRAAAAHTAITTLDTLLRLLHPFMPFITEECAQRLPDPAPTLQRRDWPASAATWSDHGAGVQRAAVDELLQLVQRLRALRDENGVPRNQRHRLQFSGGDPAVAREDRVRLLTALVPVDVLDGDLDGGVTVVAGHLEARYHMDGGERENARARRRLLELETTMAHLGTQLANQAFVARARPDVVADARRRLEEATRERDALAAGEAHP